MPRVLITGGSGQIGTALTSSVPPDYDVFAPESVHLDISDSESVRRAFDHVQPDLVINAAAYTAVDKAESDRDRTFAINADGAGNVARACHASRTPLIHVSTDYVFDGTKSLAYTEADQPNPLSVYGASKLAGEQQIEDARVPHLILRVSWVFSAGGTNFVRTMLGLAGSEVLRVVDDQHGTPCAANDIATVLWLAAGRREEFGEGRLIHYASTPPTTWFRFARTIFDAALELGIVPRAPRLVPISTDGYPTAARRPANSLLDASKLARFLAFHPVDWRTSLMSVLREIGRAAVRAR